MPLHPCSDACRMAEMEEREKRMEAKLRTMAYALGWIAAQRTGGMIERKAKEALAECGMLAPNGAGKAPARYGRSPLTGLLGKED